MAFKIVNLENKDLAVTITPSSDPSALSLSSFLNAPGQSWEVILFAISNDQSFPPGMVIYNPSSGQAVAFGGNNQHLQLKPFTPPSSQEVPVVDKSLLWQMSYNPNGGSPYVSTCVPTEGNGQIWEARGGASNNAILETWNNNGGNNQRWQLIPV